MVDDAWQMHVASGLSAHFNEAAGGSRPGVRWAVELTQGHKTYRVLVLALLADDATRKTRNDDQYQAQTTMQYLKEQLRAGWHPESEMEHTIYISNPSSVEPMAKVSIKKPWWRIW